MNNKKRYITQKKDILLKHTYFDISTTYQIYIHTYIHTYMHELIYIYIVYVCMYVCMYVCIYTYVCVYVYMHKNYEYIYLRTITQFPCRCI
jgi:hypothetical protein